MFTTYQLQCRSLCNKAHALAGVRRLDLSCGLTELLREVLALADTLDVLHLSGNRLTTLPPELLRLHRLKIVFCSDHPFTEHPPEVLGECPALQVVGFKACQITRVPGAALPPSLRWLILTDNALVRLPDAIGERPLLQKLMLAGNRLSELPDGLMAAEWLELLRRSVNRFEQLPAWLTALPRLAWLALSDNPLGWAVPTPAPLPRLSWADLRLGDALGEGASGRISRVTVAGDGRGARPGAGAQAVQGRGHQRRPARARAGGQPRVAGQYPALCTPVAELCDHPQATPGLLLPLIPPGHRPLAAPPSLESCTRDVYPEGWHVGAAQALRLARSVAGAVAHLHLRGVMHGDLYAHNLLWNPASGEGLLSDFGAATLLPTDRPQQRRALLALEARALGCLLEELVAHAQRRADDAPVWSALDALAQDCLNTDPALRPTLDDAGPALERVACD